MINSQDFVSVFNVDVSRTRQSRVSYLKMYINYLGVFWKLRDKRMEKIYKSMMSSANT